MAGRSGCRRIARARAISDPARATRIVLQTNGVLLDDEFLRICERWDIYITVGIDGDERGQDRHRDRRGASSYARVGAGLGKLRMDDRRRLFAGLLCVIDQADNPLSIYRSRLGFRPPGDERLRGVFRSQAVTAPPAPIGAASTTAAETTNIDVRQ